MFDGPFWRIAFLTAVLVAPMAFAAAPTPNLTQPSSADGQDVTDLALDPTGQFAMAVVLADAAITSLPLGGAVPQSKLDVLACDFGSVSAPGSAQNCLGAHHRSSTASSSLTQTVAVSSFVQAGSTTARFAVGGPGNKVSLWTSSSQSSAWESPDLGAPVVNVSISHDALRIVAGLDSPTPGAASQIVVIKATTQSSGSVDWRWNLTDANGNAQGVRPAAMAYARDGSYLAVGTTGTTQDPSGGTLLIFKPAGAQPRQLSDLRPQALSGSVTAIRVSDDGSAIVVGTTTGVYYFPVDGGDVPQFPFYRTPGPEGVWQVALSRDGERFAAASGSKIFFYRHLPDSRVAEAVGEYDAGAPVADLAYDGTGRLLVAAAGERVLGFAPGRSQPIWSFDATQPSSGALDAPLRHVAISQGGERFVVAGKTKVMPYLTRVAASLSSLQEANMQVVPATTVSLSFRVENTGSLDDEFSFRVTRPVGWTGTTPSAVALAPGESASVELAIDVPPGTAPGSFSVDLEAHASSLLNASRASQVATARQQVQVPRSVTLAVTASEERFELLQGNDKTLAFTVRNTGNAPGLVNFSVTQAPTRGEDWTVQITPEQARIEPGAETTVSVVVDAPLTGASGDKNVITFHASEGTYDATRAVTAYVDAQFGAELGTPNETLEFEGRASRTLSITVRNTGNTDDAFNVTAAVGSASSDWNVTVHQPVVQVPHGATRTVTLTIVPTVAEPRAATLTVRAVSQGSLDGDESSVQVTLQAKEPEPVEEGESLIPAPAPLLAALAVALAALARRARGGRP